MEKIKIQATEKQFQEIRWNYICAEENFTCSLFNCDTYDSGSECGCYGCFDQNFERVEPKRWRAKFGGKYWSIDTCNGSVTEYTEEPYYIHEVHYNSFNYFKTHEEAMQAYEKTLDLWKNHYESTKEK